MFHQELQAKGTNEMFDFSCGKIASVYGGWAGEVVYIRLHFFYSILCNPDECHILTISAESVEAVASMNPLNSSTAKHVKPRSRTAPQSSQ